LSQKKLGGFCCKTEPPTKDAVSKEKARATSRKKQGARVSGGWEGSKKKRIRTEPSAKKKEEQTSDPRLRGQKINSRTRGEETVGTVRVEGVLKGD